uniref:Uncharacterized protein n=1 Tax=Podoviridae sp. cttxo15 TaxID=2826584 RepID=A0A8S5N1Z5_9CAUD|nr:MAG TPA: hypothetical protein [Podoviridae sp. cttxo15]
MSYSKDFVQIEIFQKILFQQETIRSVYLLKFLFQMLKGYRFPLKFS